MKKFVFSALSLLLTLAATAQGVKIGDTEGLPVESAILEVTSTSKGLLPPRMTTTERDAIQNPANGLLIFNTTTQCYEGYYTENTSWSSFGCLCPIPEVISALALPNTLCEGGTLNLIGSGTGVTTWSWTGPNDFISSNQTISIDNVTALNAGIYTLTASNHCGQSAPVTVQVNVTPLPTAANAGIDQNITCGRLATDLTGNVPVSGTGMWTVISGTATIANPSSPTTQVTDLSAPSSVILRWTISNGTCVSSDDMTIIVDSPTISDINGNVYNMVLIGSQCWMKENLNTGKYLAPGSIQGNNSIIEKYCQNLSGQTDSNCPLGGLYQWDEVMNYSTPCNGVGMPPGDKCLTPVQGICPVGWHIPSHYEWTTLERNVGSNPSAFAYNTSDTGYKGTDEGGNLKATSSWSLPNTGATNSSEFTALPAGIVISGALYDANNYGHWWTSTQNAGTKAWRRFLANNSKQVFRADAEKTAACSVRCLKN